MASKIFIRPLFTLCVILFIPITLSAQHYCTPVYTAKNPCLGSGFTIKSLTLNTYNGAAVLSCKTAVQGYDTTSLALGNITSLTGGGKYPYFLDYGSSGSRYPSAGGVWIDFNKNGTFDDATELVDSINPLPLYAFWKGTVKIPLWVQSGTYRIRFRIVNDCINNCKKYKPYLFTNGGCNSHLLGNARDFYVKISRSWSKDIALSNLWPNSSCSLDSMEKVMIKLKNTGFKAINKGDTVICGYAFQGRPLITDTLILPAVLMVGDSLFHTFTKTVNMAAKGVYKFVAWVRLKGDSNTTNDTLMDTRYNKTIFTTPYSENFEKGIPNTWINDPNDAGPDWGIVSSYYKWYEWYFFDHTYPLSAKGHCVDINYPQFGFGTHYKKFDSINLITPCFDLGRLTKPIAEFWLINSVDFVPYHNTTKDSTSVLYIDAYYNGKWYYNIDSPLYNIGLFGGYQGLEKWKRIRLDLSKFKGITSLKFRISTGKISTASNVYLDDFRIYDLKNADMGITAMLSPNNKAYGDSSTPITVAMKNFGSASQSNIPFEVKITGKRTGFVAILKDTLRATLAPDGLDTFVIKPHFNSFPGDVYYINAYTSIAADSINDNDTTKDTVSIRAGIPRPAVAGIGRCSAGQVKLFVTNNTSAKYTTYWYDSLNTGLPVFQGDTFLTPSLGKGKRYYAAFSDVGTIYHLGPKNDSVVSKTAVNDTDSNTAQYNGGGFGQGITARDTFDLDSVTIYPNHSGTITFHYVKYPAFFVDGGPDAFTLPPLTIKVVQNGKPYSRVKIPVGLRIPAGDNAIVYATIATGGLTYNDSTTAYPFSSPNVTIFGDVNVPPGGFQFWEKQFGYYYYVYNWRIREYGGYSKRTPVLAEIDSPGIVRFGARENCFGQVQYYDSSIYSAARPPVYHWQFGDGGIDSAINPLHKYPAAGTYNASLKLSFNKTCKDSFNKSITVSKGMDTAWSLQSKPGRLLNYTGNDSTAKYTWYFGDSSNSLAVKGSHAYSKDGFYHVQMHISGLRGCSFNKDTLVNILTTATGFSALNEFNLNVSPNPYTSQAQITYTLPEPSITALKIMDISGKELVILQNPEVRKGQQQLVFNPAKYNLKPGLYLLQLNVNNMPIIIKLIQLE
jgi:hypothetical protein